MRSDSSIVFITVLIALVTMTLTISVLFGDVLSQTALFESITPITAISLGLTTTLISTLILQRFLSSRAPLAYNVAIIGFPKSGKTTLITSLFGEIFARRIKGIEASLSGDSTIDRVNRDLALIQQGKALGPTKDQDLFAYRTNVRLGSKLIPRNYKVEFGDFPGEDSVQYSEQYGEWLHSTPFFKWVVDADALIFVVDLGEYLLSRLSEPHARNKYAVRMSSAIRAAWQHILDANLDREREVRRRPIVLVLNKADLLMLREVSPVGTVSESSKQRVLDKIKSIGFGSETPKIKEVNPENFEPRSKAVLGEFDDLIEYLDGESKYFTHIFTSSFRTVGRSLLGAEQLLNLVLPRT